MSLANPYPRYGRWRQRHVWKIEEIVALLAS
jgi:hypothetical protein